MFYVCLSALQIATFVLLQFMLTLVQIMYFLLFYVFTG